MNEILSTINPTSRRPSIYDSTTDLMDNSVILINQRDKVKSSEM